MLCIALDYHGNFQYILYFVFKWCFVKVNNQGKSYSCCTYLPIYVCYSYSLTNGIPLVKASAITNLVEHPIQLRPPSKSLFSLFTMFETFLLQDRIFVKKFPVYCMKLSMHKFMKIRNRVRIGMHIRYYVFKPCKGHLKVYCLYGTGLARVNRAVQK